QSEVAGRRLARRGSRLVAGGAPAAARRPRLTPRPPLLPVDGRGPGAHWSSAHQAVVKLPPCRAPSGDPARGTNEAGAADPARCRRRTGGRRGIRGRAGSATRPPTGPSG